MTEEGITKIVHHTKEQLCSMFGISRNLLTLDASLKDDLDLDSIDMIELLTSINDKFEMELSPFDFDGCLTLGDFLGRIESKIGAANGIGIKDA